MKKVLCIILTLAVLMTCCAVSVSAKGKIASSLQAEMNKASDNEPIRVIIWLNNPVDQEEVFRLAIKECGYIGGLPLNMTMEEVDAYRMVYNRIVFEQEAAAVNSFIEMFGLEEACINETYCLCINANLTKAQIEAAAAYSEVEGIYFDSEGLPVEPIEDNIDPVTQTNRFKDRFDAYFSERCSSAELLTYKEPYCHQDHNGETDWVLIYAASNLRSPSFLNIIVGNRVMMLSCYGTPFDTGYGVYDVKNDTFVDAASAQAKSYPDFVTVFDELGGGRLIGDLDGDDTLSIVDVTVMQRCLAWMRDFPSDDEIIPADGAWGYSCRYYSDFDRDGEREITDATMLQRYLIGIV